MNIFLILRDGDLAKNADDIEVVVGILGAVFHDIGNSVVGRYDDAYRYASHAEVGAYLFGQIAEGIIPPHIRELTQYAIAAHAHYLKPFSIEKANGETAEKVVYDDTTEKSPKGQIERMGLWMVRQADRGEQAEPYTIRHMIAHVEPRLDYLGTSHVYPKENPDEDFIAQFRMKSESPSILNHLSTRAATLTDNSDYTSHDSPYIRQHFFAPARKSQERLVEIMKKDVVPPLTPMQRTKGLERLLRAWRLFESGKDIETIIEKFEGTPEKPGKFFLKTEDNEMTQSDRDKWIVSTNFLIDDLLTKSWYPRMERGLKNFPKSLKPFSKNVQTLVKETQVISQRVLSGLNPAYIDNNFHHRPDITTLLTHK